MLNFSNCLWAPGPMATIVLVLADEGVDSFNFCSYTNAIDFMPWRCHGSSAESIELNALMRERETSGPPSKQLSTLHKATRLCKLACHRVEI